jgi:hypothetical protein
MTGSLLATLDLKEIVSAREWSLFRPVLIAAIAEGIPFALGGGLAWSAYTGRKRSTKDMDLFVLPGDRQHLIALLDRAGFVDYYDQLSYDRKWIYRGWQDGAILDVIWQMANYRALVDNRWVMGGPAIELYDQLVRLLPPEELLWSKLYVLQRDRCDWPDVWNLANAVGPELDWQHLLERIGDDVPVLGGMLSIFGWLCPLRARELPAWLWERAGLKGPANGPGCDVDQHRIRLLDSRDWFG